MRDLPAVTEHDVIERDVAEGAVTCFDRSARFRRHGRRGRVTFVARFGLMAIGCRIERLPDRAYMSSGVWGWRNDAGRRHAVGGNTPSSLPAGKLALHYWHSGRTDAVPPAELSDPARRYLAVTVRDHPEWTTPAGTERQETNVWCTPTARCPFLR
jgi:hypothetical protein